MKTKIKVLIIVFSVVFSVLTTFILLVVVKAHKTHPLSSQIFRTFTCNALPGAYSTDPWTSKGKIVETDMYGRMICDILIIYVVPERALCVMQKVDEEQQCMYYYDNICFKYIDGDVDKDIMYDQSFLDSLKELNDWGKPLDLEKCTRKQLNDNKKLLPAVLTRDYTARSSIEQRVIDELQKRHVFTKYDYDVACCDKSASEQELYLISVWEEDASKDYDNYRYHAFVIYNKDKSYDPENYLMEFDDLRDCNEVLIEIKEKNGWVATK